MLEARWADDHLYDGIQGHLITFDTARVVLTEAAQRSMEAPHATQNHLAGVMLSQIFDRIDEIEDQAEVFGAALDQNAQDYKIWFKELLALPQDGLQHANERFDAALTEENSASKAELHGLNQEQIAYTGLQAMLEQSYVEHLKRQTPQTNSQ